MATLIQSKQIEGVVTASVIEGGFTVSGSIIGTDITASAISSSGPIYGVRYGDIQGTPNFIGGSGILITHVGNNITITNTGGGGGVSGSAELITSVALLNEYTGSNDIIILGLQSQINALIAQTGSYETKGRGIISGSSQLTSSFDSRYALSGSAGGGVSSWNDLRNIPAGIVSSSVQILGGSGVLSGSQTDITSLNQFTQSIQTNITSLSSSIDSRLLSLERKTDNTGSDSQTLTIVGNQLTISNGNTITIPTGSNSQGISSWNELRDIPSGLVSGSYVQSLPNGLISSSVQILGGSGILSGSQTDITALNQFTSSTQPRISSLEAFTSSLDSTYVKKTDLSSLSSSLNSRIVSLESKTDNTGSDSQILSIAGDKITISGGNTITIPTGSGNTSTHISDAPPTSSIEGDLWWNSADGNLYIYYDGYWVIAVDYVSAVSQSVAQLPAGLVSGSQQLTSAASASGIALSDVELIKGAFYTVAFYTDLANIPISRISNKQIVWVDDAGMCYQATVVPPDFVTTFESSVTWAEFMGFGAGIGDITGVIAGSGLTGGSFSGVATLNIGAGKGISVSADSVSVDTGSLHFQQGVEYWISSGSFIIDSGKI